jgi:hypothetical protein
MQRYACSRGDMRDASYAFPRFSDPATNAAMIAEVVL